MVTAQVTLDQLPTLLANDTKVKVAGVDGDGLLRGKVISREKFLSVVQSGFGMSSAIFGWDMHDQLYTNDVPSELERKGFVDFLAFPDLNSFRRIPWEGNIPFFLLNFEQDGKSVPPCGRSMLRTTLKKLAELNCRAFAGVELEFINFQTPAEDGYDKPSTRRNIGAFLAKHCPSLLRPLTSGMFGYSITRPMESKDFFYDIYDQSIQFTCPIECWHTESGPGVYEAAGSIQDHTIWSSTDITQALTVCDVNEMADRVTLFKLLAKSIGVEHGVTPCFMAKPMHGMPGNSGHIHISLCNLEGKNLFARDPDPNAQWPDLSCLSETGQFFLAGLLDALPDVMVLFAPTINSYKRLVENYWAPVHLSWGLEDRKSSIRLVAPPVCEPSATRFEVRIPGADLHPHYALNALLTAGWRGVQKRLPLRIAPLSTLTANDPKPQRLPQSLEEALWRFTAPESISRELFDAEFIEYFARSRGHELRLWREAVTDWEVRRYIETV